MKIYFPTNIIYKKDFLKLLFMKIILFKKRVFITIFILNPIFILENESLKKYFQIQLY